MTRNRSFPGEEEGYALQSQMYVYLLSMLLSGCMEEHHQTGRSFDQNSVR